jgi:hypothetical protein
MSAGTVELPDKKRKPVAVCTRCGAYSLAAECINQPCRRPVGRNKKCNGCWGSALNIGDWETCHYCKGTGDPPRDDIVAQTDRTSVCTSCRGTGWIYVRDTKHFR